MLTIIIVLSVGIIWLVGQAICEHVKANRNKEMAQSGIVICPRCLNEIDPECCWCGDPMKGHTAEHFAVPMGCDCLRSDSLDRPPL